MTKTPALQPFEAFFRSIATTSYDDVRAVPGTEVESESAFEEMRAYLLDLYDGVSVERSFVDNGGGIIDRIPRDLHPAARESGDDTTGDEPARPPTTEPGNGESPYDTSDSVEASANLRSLGFDEVSRDESNRTLPMTRVTLEQLARFKNLAALSEKDSGPAFDIAGDFERRYATGEQNIDCLGGFSRVNVWKPFVTPTLQGTFSQQWFMAGQDGTVLQTVECGWHVDFPRYGDVEPHLFVFSTRDTYAKGTGGSIFNEDGGVFKLVSNPPVSPGRYAPLPVSQFDGFQVEYPMGFYLTDGAWWFYFNFMPVGRYPLSWFQNGPMTRGATRAKFGGEVVKAPILSSWPPMGSASHASAGYRRAAYQRAATVYPAAGSAIDATLQEAGAVTGPCYTTDITNSSGTDWGTYLFFGGPGGQPC